MLSNISSQTECCQDRSTHGSCPLLTSTPCMELRLQKPRHCIAGTDRMLIAECVDCGCLIIGLRCAKEPAPAMQC
jgi:hypothetical protein